MRRAPGFFAVVITVSVLVLAGAVCAAAGVDSTQKYSNAYRSDCAFGAAHVEVLRRHTVLFVPGYFSDLNPLHFSDQLQWLATMGVEHQKVRVKSRQGVEINSPIIATAIRDAAKPVILITHSKGSIDALDALRAESSLRPKVSGWISLQGPFLGSPLADMLFDETRLNPLIATFIFEFLGGTRESARSLTTTASLAYYRDHKPAIDRVVREVSGIAFASALEGASDGRARTRLEVPHELMRIQGIRNDGLVPLDAAVLPGMDFVKISGVDHIAPVTAAVQRFDRIRMTKALLLLLRPFSGVQDAGSCEGQR